jgi:hypothetical protein
MSCRSRLLGPDLSYRRTSVGTELSQCAAVEMPFVASGAGLSVLRPHDLRPSHSGQHPSPRHLTGRLNVPSRTVASPDPQGSTFDVFISHAGEDNDFARPLANELVARGLSVWFDAFELRVGDSLREQISRGLDSARFGVVILSPHFFDKQWTRHELDALTARELKEERSVILPVWHHLTAEDVRAYHPGIADTLAADTRAGVRSVANDIIKAVLRQTGRPAPRALSMAHLAGVLGPDGGIVATSFQVSPGTFVTTLHTLSELARGERGATVLLQPLPADLPVLRARVDRVDDVHDLAVLRSDDAVPESVTISPSSDDQGIGTLVSITGVARGDVPAVARAYGLWRGGETLHESVARSRVESTEVLAGMIGSPVARLSDGALLGVLSATHTPSGEGPTRLHWVVRTEDLQQLVRDVATAPSMPRDLRQAERGLRLFYSYSHRDERYRMQLETHLALLRRQGIITDWHDRKISGGAEWREAIDTELRAAHVIVLMVSPDFMASDFAYLSEMTIALRRNEAGTARVVPVIIRPVDWQDSPIGKLQALPNDGKPITLWKNRDLAWWEVSQGIRQVASELARRLAA